jgi:DNA-binding MarR family transcriptional regulator
MESDSPQNFSARQGQYLAFIHAYTFVNGRPPAQSDIARFFRVTPPTVHQMILTLEKAGWISRRPAAPRAIAVLVDPTRLPDLGDAAKQVRQLGALRRRGLMV